MQNDLHNDISKIKSFMECSKNFICTESEFKTIGKARDIGLSNFVECLEVGNSCSFRFSFGYKNLCSCPLRVYISQKLKK